MCVRPLSVLTTFVCVCVCVDQGEHTVNADEGREGEDADNRDEHDESDEDEEEQEESDGEVSVGVCLGSGVHAGMR